MTAAEEVNWALQQTHGGLTRWNIGTCRASTFPAVRRSRLLPDGPTSGGSHWRGNMAESNMAGYQ